MSWQIDTCPDQGDVYHMYTRYGYYIVRSSLHMMRICTYVKTRNALIFCCSKPPAWQRAPSRDRWQEPQ